MTPAPLASWRAVEAACLERARRAGRPWVLGIQGPQGCGKSTLASRLVTALGAAGLRAAALSIDDVYLTHAEQERLAARFPGNRCLRYRGYPGTHDVALGAQALDALRGLGAGTSFAVPSYDKSAHAGRGDRAPRASWRSVEGPLDAVIFEGWMLGFSRAPEAGLEPDLVAPNAMLAAYAAWNERLDALLRLDVDDLDTVVTWRVDSERARRERGESALSDEDARDYVERFLPAYRLYVPGLDERPPCEHVMRVRLGRDRAPRGG